MKPQPATEALTQAQFIAHLGFVLTGVVNTLLGPILPIITRTWHLDDAQAGRLFAAQFLGAILGTLASAQAAVLFAAKFQAPTPGTLPPSRGITASATRPPPMLGLLLRPAGE